MALSTAWIMVIIISAILLLVFLGWLYWYFLSDGKTVGKSDPYDNERVEDSNYSWHDELKKFEYPGVATGKYKL
jgi:hypothetical protein